MIASRGYSQVVLVIDGDAPALSTTCTVLTEAGYEVMAARDRASAQAAIRECPPDLLLSDIHVGGESGREMCRELRREPALRNVPLMYLSANQRPAVIRRVDETDGAYYLHKPFDPEVLVELVNRTLDRVPGGRAG